MKSARKMRRFPAENNWLNREQSDHLHKIYQAVSYPLAHTKIGDVWYWEEESMSATIKPAVLFLAILSASLPAQAYTFWFDANAETTIGSGSLKQLYGGKNYTVSGSVNFDIEKTTQAFKINYYSVTLVEQVFNGSQYDFDVLSQYDDTRYTSYPANKDGDPNGYAAMRSIRSQGYDSDYNLVTQFEFLTKQYDDLSWLSLSQYLYPKQYDPLTDPDQSGKSYISYVYFDMPSTGVWSSINLGDQGGILQFNDASLPVLSSSSVENRYYHHPREVPNGIPEPASALLFGSALAGLFGCRKFVIKRKGLKATGAER